MVADLVGQTDVDRTMGTVVPAVLVAVVATAARQATATLVRAGLAAHPAELTLTHCTSLSPRPNRPNLI